MEVVPAIEEKTAQEFSLSLSKVASFATRVQVDFNDGSFAGFTTVRPSDITDLPAGKAGLLTEYTDRMFFEAHLMVQKPQEMIYDLVDLGFKKIIVQYEIENNVREILEELQQMEVLVGMAIGPGTSVFDIEPYADFLDTITVMDIEPGKQGQKFMEAELQKIRELKEGNFGGEVQADGAINLDTVQEVIGARPDTLVVGSYIVKSSNPAEAYENLVRLI